MEIIKKDNHCENDSVEKYASFSVRHDVDWSNKRIIITLLGKINKNIKLQNDLLLIKKKHIQLVSNKESPISSSTHDLTVWKKKYKKKIINESKLYDKFHYLLKKYKKHNTSINESYYDKLIKLIEDLKKSDN